MDVDKRKNCKQIAAAVRIEILLTWHEDFRTCHRQLLKQLLLMRQQRQLSSHKI